MVARPLNGPSIMKIPSSPGLIQDTIPPYSMGDGSAFTYIRLYFPERCIFYEGDIIRLHNRDEVRVMDIGRIEDFFETYTEVRTLLVSNDPSKRVNYTVYDATRLYSTVVNIKY
jgi:hypothetical protein